MIIIKNGQFFSITKARVESPLKAFINAYDFFVVLHKNVHKLCIVIYTFHDTSQIVVRF